MTEILIWRCDHGMEEWFADGASNDYIDHTHRNYHESELDDYDEWLEEEATPDGMCPSLEVARVDTEEIMEEMDIEDRFSSWA